MPTVLPPLLPLSLPHSQLRKGRGAKKGREHVEGEESTLLEHGGAGGAEAGTLLDNGGTSGMPSQVSGSLGLTLGVLGKAKKREHIADLGLPDASKSSGVTIKGGNVLSA